MYLSIQKIQGKLKRYGYPKGVVTYKENVGTTTYYRWKYTGEKFERPNFSYKFVIKESYRDHGKVKQRQLCLGTIFWYAFIFERQDIWTESNKTRARIRFNSSESQLKQIAEDIDTAIDKIESKIGKKWIRSKEYKAYNKYYPIVDLWNRRKKLFGLEYGEENLDKFEQIYDLYNNIHNQSLLDQLKTEKTEKEAKEKAEEERQEQQWENASKWVNEEYARRFGKLTNYSDDEKAYLKRFYRTLAKNYHPDLIHDDGEAMKFLNKLKDQWGV